MNQYVSYGGGVNSTAMGILLLTDPRFAYVRERGEIRFIMADTGDEWPETMAFVKDVFDPWIKSRGFHLFSKKYPLAKWILKGRIRKDNSGGCAAACFSGQMKFDFDGLARIKP